MFLFVVTLTGKRITIDLDGFESPTVDDLQARITDKEGVPASQQRLSFAGARLAPGRLLADYRISNESTIHMVLG